VRAFEEVFFHMAPRVASQVLNPSECLTAFQAREATGLDRMLESVPILSRLFLCPKKIQHGVYLISADPKGLLTHIRLLRILDQITLDGSRTKW